MAGGIPAGTVQEQTEAESQASAASPPGASTGDGAVWVEPDLDFIRALNRQGGDSLKKCFQCGTCSATCNLSPETDPFPRKEMAWATWGMKDRLLRDPDVWLCYHCNDCSTICPRGGGPGNVLAAVREECVRHYAVPRFLGRWVGQPQAVPLLLAIPAALLAVALFLRGPIAELLGISGNVQFGKAIVYPYSAMFPHWLLNSFFGLFSLLALLSVAIGVGRFWRAMKEGGATFGGDVVPVRSLPASIVTVLKGVFTHDKFAICEKARSRFWSHTLVFYGFLALTLVTFWVITAKINPLIQGEFIYPFNFFSPWKMLANIGGLAVLAGCGLMIWDRLKDDDGADVGSYFDWLLISTLVIVVLTGFVAETLHIIHLEPHRHIAYFVHLVFVFSLLIYVPYSKLAHIFYRTAALVYAEHTGRDNGSRPAGGAPAQTPRNRRNIMPDKATGSPAGSGRGLLAVVLVLVILVPVGYSVYARVSTTEPPEFLDPPQGTACVRDTEYMRYHHWELLKGLREEVVRYGNRGDISFDLPVDAGSTRSCWNCHQSKVRFCDRCHDAAFVHPDCFGCHYYPDLGERELVVGETNHE